MARIDRIINTTLNDGFRTMTTNYIVQTPVGVLYMVYIDDSSDAVYIKSSDAGITWSAPTVIFTGTVTHLSIWYDRWSSISAGLIHCAYTETTGHDCLYRSIDTESSDTLSSETTIFNGASAQSGAGHLSISRARGGNLYCAFNIDAGVEEGFYRSTDVGAVWGARTTHAETSNGDQVILLPGWAADNQDMMLFFADTSASGLSRKLYDDSANSWAETAIASDTTMTVPASGNDCPPFAAAVDIANSRNVLVAWSARDTLNADLRCWTVTESAITEVTNVVQNSTDDQMLASIAIDTGTSTWYAFYAGKSDGSETVNTSLHLYYKTSTDSGTTWGAETVFSQQLRNRRWINSCPRFTGHFLVGQIFVTPNAGVFLLGLSHNIATGGASIIGG